MLTYDEPLIMSGQPALSAATCRYPESGCLMRKVQRGGQGARGSRYCCIEFFCFCFVFLFFSKPFSANFDFKDFNVRHLALRSAVFHPFG